MSAPRSAIPSVTSGDQRSVLREPLHITSPKSAHFRRALKLRQSRERLRTGCFLVDAMRELTRAVECGYRVREIFLPDNDPSRPRVVREQLPKDFPCVTLAPTLFQRLSYGERDSEIVSGRRSSAATPRLAGASRQTGARRARIDRKTGKSWCGIADCERDRDRCGVARRSSRRSLQSERDPGEYRARSLQSRSFK